jgi:hypothetical protein
VTFSQPDDLCGENSRVVVKDIVTMAKANPPEELATDDASLTRGDTGRTPGVIVW